VFLLYTSHETSAAKRATLSAKAVVSGPDQIPHAGSRARRTSLPRDVKFDERTPATVKQRKWNKLKKIIPINLRKLLLFKGRHAKLILLNEKNVPISD